MKWTKEHLKVAKAQLRGDMEAEVNVRAALELAAYGRGSKSADEVCREVVRSFEGEKSQEGER